jgi:protein-disulfide isomerase
MMHQEPQPTRKSAIFRTLLTLTVLLSALAIQSPLQSQTRKVSPPNCLGGTPDAPIQMEVFSDFQCGYCRAFYVETITQVLKSYTPSDKICVTYYEFPLDMHPYSRKAARYSLAAQRVGKAQWLAVIDALYTRQEQWGQDGNIDAALKGTMSADDLELTKKIMQDPSIEDAIKRDISLGESRGVTGTPAIFMTVLNKKHPKYPYAPFQVWKDFFDTIVK